jgi:hypothetical protein
MAGESIDFMVVGLKGKWKWPIAYFLNKNVSATIICPMFKLLLTAA